MKHRIVPIVEPPKITPFSFKQVFIYLEKLRNKEFAPYYNDYYRSEYYKVLRTMAKRLDCFKARQRGNSTLGYQVMKAKQNLKQIMHTIKEGEQNDGNSNL
jgi:hypothetical protein